MTRLFVVFEILLLPLLLLFATGHEYARPTTDPERGEHYES